MRDGFIIFTNIKKKKNVNLITVSLNWTDTQGKNVLRLSLNLFIDQ